MALVIAFHGYLHLQCHSTALQTVMASRRISPLFRSARRRTNIALIDLKKGGDPGETTSQHVATVGTVGTFVALARSL